MNRRKEALRRLLGKPEENPGVYSWTRRWMFEWARFLNPGFKVGKYIRIDPGDFWLISILYGPRIQHFRKDHGKPGEIWNPRRWGGAILVWRSATAAELSSPPCAPAAAAPAVRHAA